MPKSWGKGKPAEVAFRIRTALDRGDLPRFAATSNRDAVSAQFTLFKVSTPAYATGVVSSYTVPTLVNS